MTSTAAPAAASASRAAPRLPVALATVGAATFLVGLFAAPSGVWPGYLLAVFALTGAGLAGAVFLALHHVCGARWGRPILGVPQAMTGALPWAGVGVLALAFGAEALYPWVDRAAVAADEALSARAGWMTVPWVLARAAACFLVWVLLARVLVARSRRAAREDDPASRSAAARAGAWFLVAFAPTFSVFCFDWVLSLERHWASTMTAVYHFSGLLLSGLALITILAVAERRRGRLAAQGPWEDTLHDLGKLTFAFSFFWGYIWFCQWMLVWYTNLPEETPHYAQRHAGGWLPIAFLAVLLQWLVPFVILMPRAMKRSERVLARVGAMILLGRALDLFLEIVQPGQGAQPGLGGWEVGLLAGAAGVFLVAFRRSASTPAAFSPSHARPGPPRTATVPP